MKSNFKLFGIILVLILLLLPTIVYVLNFRNFKISNSPEDWSSFSDYIGGITNTIISLISLIVLAYISWVVSRFSSNENKNLYFLERRIEAYDELMKFIPTLHLSPIMISQKIKFIDKIADREGIKGIDKIDIKLEEISKEILFCHEYHQFLFNFNPRYSHLFKYDFTSDNYLNLVSTAKIFCKAMDDYYQKLSIGKPVESNIQGLFDKHSDYLLNFINSLRDELE